MLATGTADEVVLFPNSVLRMPARRIDDITDETHALHAHLSLTLHKCGGLGLAANQVGVPLAMFVYYGPDNAEHTVINPKITESSGEWLYKEGCLSLPGMFWYITRPKEVLLTGIDLDGNELEIEADELLARLFQHEVDHIDGRLVLDRIPKPQAKAAIRKLTAK